MKELESNYNGEREKESERERVFKSLKQCTYISKYIHILCQTFVLHNIVYKICCLSEKYF